MDGDEDPFPRGRPPNHLDDLARLVFVLNRHRAPIHLSLEHLESSVELFLFCFGLFNRGLLVAAGLPPPEEGGEAAMDEVTAAHVEFVGRAMEAAGIRIDLRPLRVEGDEGDEGDEAGTTRAPREPPRPPGIDVTAVLLRPPDLPLREYHLVASDGERAYRLSFELVHFLGDRVGCHVPSRQAPH